LRVKREPSLKAQHPTLPIIRPTNRFLSRLVRD
jgi:hypothetical protein